LRLADSKSPTSVDERASCLASTNGHWSTHYYRAARLEGSRHAARRGGAVGLPQYVARTAGTAFGERYLITISDPYVLLTGVCDAIITIVVEIAASVESVKSFGLSGVRIGICIAAIVAR